MPVDLTSFAGKVFPADIVTNIINAGLAGAPVFSALTRRTTSRHEVAFPVGDPSGFVWTAELAELPLVDPGDDTKVYAVAKLAGRILLSNESVGDSELNLTREVGRLIAESMAAKADKDLLYGDGTGATPTGFYPGLTAVTNASLRVAVVDAAAQIMEAGGNPDTVIVSPSQWAAEVTRREATAAGSGLFSDISLPLKVIVANSLTPGDGLVLDSRGAFGITRTDWSIEASTEAGEAWTHDGVSLRVKARLAAAIPVPAKSARRIGVA